MSFFLISSYNQCMSATPKKTVPTGPVLVEHFARDVSLEVFSPPSPSDKKGDKELQCNITLHALPKNDGKRLEIVVATRLFIHSRQTGQGLLLADHAYIGAFDTSRQKGTEISKAVQKDCAEVLYPLAQKSLKSFLQQTGYNPPLPEEIDIDKLIGNTPSA
jgi:preprotein translocase subunit SecB